MPTFNYTPDFGAQKQQKPRVKKIQFGEGYSQRAVFGMNTTPQIWSLTFKFRDKVEADAIEAFLIAQRGADVFDWVPPYETNPIKVTCEEWSRSVDRFNLNTINATFEQQFEP